MSFGVTDDVGSNGRHRARDAADNSELPRRRSRREAWDSPPPVGDSRRRPDPLTDPLGALESPSSASSAEERQSRRERRGYGEADEVPPGRSMGRRDESARGSARRGHPDEVDRPRRVPQQRRPELAEDGGRVLPRRPHRTPETDAPPSDRPRRSPDLPDRPRGIADTGDHARRSGEIVDRPRGIADTGDHARRSGEIVDRPRGIADTGDHVRRSGEIVDRPRGIADTGDHVRRSGEIVDRPRGVADTGDRSRRGAEAGDRPRGVAETGDRMRRSGEIGDRSRGVADTGDHLRRSGEIDRPRGVADTGERARTAARASVPVAGRAVVGEPVRPEIVRPETVRPEAVRPEAARPEAARLEAARLETARLEAGRAERTSGRVAPAPEHARSSRSAQAVSRTPAGEPDAVRRINPFDLPEPRGYSHATIASGQIVFLAAQSGVDIDGRIVDGGLVAQFDRAVQNLITALTAAGGSPEQLVSITVQVTSIDDYKANSRPIGHVWRARLGGLMPALSISEVRRFWDPQAEIQIAGCAAL
ncbi:Rid family hydrolase [Cryptosporangium sp. NPDC048952]|uniref:Rid family hydrolase n=1 Tax=Cryptosporangium sp. NPDC048952 TaxID=3363961 RepID=UPI003713C2C8